MKETRDQLGRSIILTEFPHRIVSLVPSQTELLHYLELQEEVVGITKFCVHPGLWRRSKTIVGGTKNPDIDKIRELKPDLILANKEENRKEDIDELSSEFPVWVSDVRDLNTAVAMIQGIGDLTGRSAKANELSENLNTSFRDLLVNNYSKAVYLIWWDPIMIAGKDTFISQMMHYAGFENACPEYRYPIADIESLRKLEVDFILLSSEPFPFSEKHRLLLQKDFPSAKIRVVDGEMFSWYGPRMLQFPQYLSQLEY